jgi:AraC-like DNA-binding protein/quercetin dioxygenase-like cupin family protein
MMPLSEPVPLLPGVAALVQQISQAAATPVPERFLHFHGPSELVLVQAGSGRLLCEGNEIAFAPGSILFVPAMAVHDFAFDAGARGWTLVQFDPHAVDAAIVALPQVARGAALDDETFARAAMLMRWLAETLVAPVQPQAVAIQLQALMMLLSPALNARATDLPTASIALGRFRPLLDNLGQSASPMLQVAEAASLCAMSSGYFSRRFKQMFGVSFNAYQTRMKLQQAARMVATSSVPVSQIAYRLGFQSHAYFSHCYKAMFGVPPSHHRKGKSDGPSQIIKGANGSS